MNIYGAGISGLLAGCLFQTAKLFEASPENTEQHKAVLRFRSSAVGDAVGIDFRKVVVHKGLWYEDKPAQPSIMLANLYSKKVIGSLADRSIWNLASAERFIAPEDFVCQLIERCRGRIEWNCKLTAEDVMESKGPAVSTLPMSVMADFVDHYSCEPLLCPEFKYEPIFVRRFRVKGADVFQTVYFPDPITTLYRVSMTGDMLIAEYVGEPDNYYFWDTFGIHHTEAERIEQVSQRYGKIAKIDDNWRKQFIFNLSTQSAIFSLGRFGTWRNILLDDVIKDVGVIKKLMNTNNYARARHSAK